MLDGFKLHAALLSPWWSICFCFPVLSTSANSVFSSQLDVVCFTTDRRLPVFFCQGTRATPACAPPTARRATAAPAISGPRSASRCWGRARCAPSRGRKALTAWRSSSDATAPRASPARCGKTPPPRPSPGSTCARRSEAEAAAVGVEASVSICQGKFFLKGWVVAVLKRSKRQRLTRDRTDCVGSSPLLSERRVNGNAFNVSAAVSVPCS